MFLRGLPGTHTSWDHASAKRRGQLTFPGVGFPMAVSAVKAFKGHKQRAAETGDPVEVNVTHGTKPVPVARGFRQVGTSLLWYAKNPSADLCGCTRVHFQTHTRSRSMCWARQEARASDTRPKGTQQITGKYG